MANGNGQDYGPGYSANNPLMPPVDPTQRRVPPVNPLVPGVGLRDVDVNAPYNNLRVGLPAYGTAVAPMNYQRTPTSAPPPTGAPQGAPAQAGPDYVPPMQVNDMTKQAGFGNKFGRFPSNPIGMIVHHTGGGDNVEQVINTYRSRNLPAQFVIDRDGKIYQALPNGYRGQHIQAGWGPVGEGKSNADVEGVEIIAKNNDDVLPIQQQAAANLIGQRAAMWGYNPQTSVWGHGEVNPGHKEPDEGMAVVSGIRDGSLAVPDYTKVIRPMTLQPMPGQPEAPQVAQVPRTTPQTAPQATSSTISLPSVRTDNPMTTGLPVGLVPPSWLPQIPTNVTDLQTQTAEAPGG